MQGRKKHEQFRRELEHKDDIPDPRESGAQPAAHVHTPEKQVRDSEFAVSERGMNRESEHNKHNHAPRGAAKHAT